MARFIEKNIIYRYGLPYHVVTDNGVQFWAETKALLKEYKIEHHILSLYRPQANGAVEAAN